MTRKNPLVLGFDTSQAHCAAALLQGGNVLSERREEMTKGQAERLMDLLAGVLSDAGVSYGDLDAIGVGTGPGNFTGIRIAISAARGLALGLGIPAVGVSLFDALREGTPLPCACTIDARRQDVYFQAFDRSGSACEPEVVPAAALPHYDGPMIGVGGIDPVFPTAVAIARLAAQRFTDAPARPAPLYIRPADAAPARDTAPVILP